jgi:glycosyltransferase involved in cell wall biosynthesis
MKILFLQKRVLFPTDTGGRIRTLNIVRHLARWHELVYLCNLQPGEEQFIPAMEELGLRLVTVPWREVPRESWGFYRDLALNLFSKHPFNVNKDFDPALRAKARELVAAQSFDLLVCDFVQMARNALGLPGAAKLLFEHNVEAQIFERHARTDKGRLRRRFMAYQAGKMRAFEGWAGRQFDAVVAVSHQDKHVFERDYGWRHVQTIDTAVDTDFFRPREGVEQADQIVFVGSLDWLPNQDGLTFFARSIWPLIRAKKPSARFQIVGRNPSDEIIELGRIEGIEVIGTVPDTRPWLAQAAVVAVPLRIGGGTRIKIFEAMAMGKAVVSTSLGAEGLPVTSGQDLLIADQPEQFAAAVLVLLERPQERRRLAVLARKLVEENYSAETVARQFERICLETAAGREQAVPAS